MDEKKWLAERFEAHRPHLRAVAYRMLGSPTEADDAVQEAWLRLGRTDAHTIENLGGWLTTVVARVCLDMLRARGTRREEPLGAYVPEPESGRRSLEGVRGGAVGQGPLELDRLIHERMRLAIVSALAVNESLSFNDLKRLLDTTDGNLSVHARKLEDADYIVCTKSFDGRVPRTEYRLSPDGRRALERYLAHMEALIRATRER